MKIPKLYTRGQFIDLMKFHTQFLTAFDLIVRYNDFLKQPLTKDMFVCEVEKPPHVFSDDPREEYSALYQSCDLYIKYKSAQKKVIFEDVSRIDFDNSYTVHLSGLPIYCVDENEVNFGFKTLHDLAEATNGELKLKNIEL